MTANLPVDWALRPIGELADVVGGGTPRRSRPELFGGSIPWLTPTDLPTTTVVPEISASAETLTEEGLRSSSARLVPAGTVIYSSRATIGKVAIAGVPLATNQGFANFIPRPGLDNRYLAYSLKAITPMVKAIAGQTTFPEISKSEFKRLSIPVPPLDEQRRIVSKLEEMLKRLEEVRALQQAANADLDSLARSILLGAFLGAL